jgi:hypothetical protein
MDQQSGSTNVDVVAGCVKLLRDIEKEIQAAMSAIAFHKLGDLEESLWRQETMCARLKLSISAIRPSVLNAASRGPLREAASALRAETQIYEKLVTRSSRSTAILQHLCSLYRNAAQHPGRAMYRSISREA